MRPEAGTLIWNSRTRTVIVLLILLLVLLVVVTHRRLKIEKPMDRVVARMFHTVDYALQCIQLTNIHFISKVDGKASFLFKIVYFISFISRSIYLFYS